MFETLHEISRKSGDRATEVWDRFLRMSFAALSYGQQESVYLRAIERIKDNRVILDLYVRAFAELVEVYENGARFADHLGDYHMEILGSRGAQAKGEYFTPEHVCQLTALMTLGDIASNDKITLHEPACGSGRFILAITKVIEGRGESVLKMRVEAIDVTASCAYMAYINFALWSIPAVVIHGNTLTREIVTSQTTPARTLALFKS